VVKTAAPPRPAPTGADGRTRDRVARLLLERGPSTAAGLGQALGLTPAAIRRHLDALVAAGTVATKETRTYGGRGRGRPARTYAVTEAGRAAFPHAYDDVAVQALRFLGETGGAAALGQFAAARVSVVEERYRESLADVRAERRPEALAEMLSSDGYAASASVWSVGEDPTGAQPSGTQLCQHHCPVQHVAEEFPQLCAAETAFISRLLGTHVQRLATIAHGDGVCTTFVPAAPASRTAPAGRTTS